MTPVVPLVDLRAQHATLSPELIRAFELVLRSGRFVLGEAVSAFEAEVAATLGVRHAIGVSSGTDALVTSLLALGIGAGDEVVTTPYTFVATAEAVTRVGAVPRFVDVEAASLNIDPEQVSAVMCSRTRAILPVHLFGHPADLEPLLAIGERAGVPILEDAAQAMGATYRGQSVGAWGALGCFSFFPSKPLGALGDGGLVVTDDVAIATRCRALRQHGAAGGGRVEYLGGNFRLDALQAAMLHVKLPHLDQWIEERRDHAKAYANALKGLPVVLPTQPTGGVWAQYVVRVAGNRRDALAKFLWKRGIETAVYYSTPLHLQPAFAHLGHKPGDFPEAERASRESLALPLFPELTVDQRDVVVTAMLEFFERNSIDAT